MSKKNGAYKKCVVCGKKYYTVASRVNKSKWCSSDCWKKRRVLNICQCCGNLIKSYHGKKYCSKKCAQKDMVGVKAPRWKDGKSLERNRARLSVFLKSWKKEVKARDNYTCQHCGSKKELHAHHIMEWAKDESKRFDVDNGTTLCIDCHGKVHNRNFRKLS